MEEERGERTMSTITIDLQNVTLTSSSLQITVQNGNFELNPTQGLSISGAVSFSSLYITSGAINFNVQQGSTFAANVGVPAEATGGTPAIRVSDFSGSATVMWMTQNGPQIQTLMSGDPVTLDGFEN
jgi:hypothetical protein